MVRLRALLGWPGAAGFVMPLISLNDLCVLNAGHSRFGIHVLDQTEVACRQLSRQLPVNIRSLVPAFVCFHRNE